MAKPAENEYGFYYQRYIDQVQNTSLTEALQDSLDILSGVLRKISPEKAEYAYAEGKWTVKQVLQHLIDAERVFAYRAMCIARGEKQPLPGFDENNYAAQATGKNRSLNEIVDELFHIRLSSILLFKSLPVETLENMGTASNQPISVRALGFIMVGHVHHHLAILQDRYLI